MQAEALKNTSVVARYADLSPDQFEAEIEKSWKALEMIKDKITDLVNEQEYLTPVQAVGIISCAAGQVFGYPEFHGQSSLSDSLVRSWVASRGGNGQ